MEVSLVGFTEKKEATHLIEFRGRHQYSDQHSNRIKAPCIASVAAGTEGEEDQMARSSLEREVGRSLMKREKSTNQERILAEHLDGLKRSGFCDFDISSLPAYQKGKTERNEQSKKRGQPK